MRKTKKYLILMGILLPFIVIYLLYPNSDSFDNLIFKGINKDSITRIRIIELRNNYDENIKIENTETIQGILSKLCELKIIHYERDIPKGWNKVYDVAFSNRNQYISYDGDKPISDITLSFYDTGYITVYGEGTLKSKTYKIISDSDIKYINELMLQS